MKIYSPEFEHGQAIPSKYTCQGKDINPPLKIEDISDRAKTLALIVEDPDAPGGNFVHWVVFNIPIINEIKEDSKPGTEGMNDFHRKTFGGPCPPSGSHRYFFRLYALDKQLPLKEGSGRDALMDAMTGDIIEKAELMGTFKKS